MVGSTALSTRFDLSCVGVVVPPAFLAISSLSALSRKTYSLLNFSSELTRSKKELHHNLFSSLVWRKYVKFWSSTYFFPKAIKPYSTPAAKISPEPKRVDRPKHIARGGMAILQMEHTESQATVPEVQIWKTRKKCLIFTGWLYENKIRTKEFGFCENLRAIDGCFLKERSAL